jgi:mannitol/fructose-specific phosphotransferase system IIA component
VDELIAREKKGSTGIGNGFAVPHAFLPELSRIVIVTLFLKKGIDIHAPDGLPVKVLFVVLAPEQKRDEYLKLLASLATTLHDPAVQRKVISAKTKEDLYHSVVHRPYESFLYTYRQYLYLLGIIAGALDYLRFNGPPWVTNQIVTFAVFSPSAWARCCSGSIEWPSPLPRWACCSPVCS